VRTRRCLRGQLSTSTYEEGSFGSKRLIIDDGNFNDGWRIVKFVVAGNGASSTEINARLCTEDLANIHAGGSNHFSWNWGDSRELAWASTRSTSESTWGGWEGAIDPDHVVIKDLYIDVNTNLSNPVNYLVILERVELTDNQAVLTLIRERSQDDERHDN
jgi:hypothetical protein